MDALSHCIEGFLADPANPPLDAVALDGVERVFTYLERAVSNGGDREARWNMLMAGLEGGMSIFKGLGPAHAIANACGDRGLHHGMLVTIALPATLRLLESRIEGKMRRLRAAIKLAPDHRVSDTVVELNRRVGVPASLRALGFHATDLEEVASDAANSWFNARSPYRPSKSEFASILEEIAG